MTEPDRDKSADNAHLYRGLGETPSAHRDPPASVVGPSGLREDPDAGRAAAAEQTSSLQPAAPRAQPARDDLGYDAPGPRRRGGSGAKVLVGAGALVGAALAYFFLRSGLGLGGGGHGGTSPSDGGASPNPPGLVQTTAPAQPASLPTASLTDAMATTAPAAPLHLTVVDETYRLGPADGKPLSLDEAVGLAKSAKPGSPVTVDSIDSSRQRAKDQLRTALEQLQINIIWTRDGKPVPGNLALPGKPGQSGDGEAPR